MIDFASMKKYYTIVVSGCQRSGTGIASRIIAEETGYQYIDEGDYGTKDRSEWIKAVNFHPNRVVVHSPAMSRFLADAGNDNVLVVYMLRLRSHVQHSIERIGWNDDNERAKYSAQNDPRHIYDIKLDFWRNVQRPLIPNWQEIEYMSLSTHPMWVDKRKRKDFTPRQWRAYSG